MAIGAVTDLGYIAPVMLELDPRRVAIPTALTIDTKLPVMSEKISGMERPFKLSKPR
jgi:hypothetical protein